MEDYIEFDGRPVPFRFEDRSGGLQPVSGAEVGTLIVEALIGAVHFPLAVAIRAIVVVVGRTATEISVELQDQRVQKRIQLRDVTARRFNDYLLLLHTEDSWDPDIKNMLRRSVLSDLRAELSRLGRMDWY